MARIDASTFFHDLLFFHRQDRPEQVAVCDGFDTYSYADLLDRAEKLAARLVSQGLRSGERIALLAKNDVAFVDLMMAVPMAGLVLVPLNFRLAQPELDFILRDAGARLIFAGAEFLDTASSVQSGCETCEATIAITPMALVVAGTRATTVWSKHGTMEARSSFRCIPLARQVTPRECF